MVWGAIVATAAASIAALLTYLQVRDRCSRSAVTVEEIERVIAHLAGLTERVSQLEERFWIEAKQHKRAAVREAVLATRLDAVESQLRQVSTKWDIAQIVLQILGAIATFIGLGFALMKAFGH